MPALPPNTTGRYFVDYSSGGVRHTFSIRANAAASPDTFGDWLAIFLSEISPLMNQFTIEEVRWQGAGSPVSNPVVTGLEGNTYGAGPASTGNDRSKFLGFVGRSGDGRRVSFQVYSVADIDATYRLSPADSSAVGDAVAALNDVPNIGLSVSGQKATWKNYGNTTDSRYWQRRLRS